MKESTSLLVKLSEMREKINGFEGEDADLDKLRTESMEMERKYRAAVESEEKSEERSETSSEGRELKGLLGKASVGKIVLAAMGQRQTDGAEKEVQEHFELPANAIPVGMLANEPEKFARATITGDEPSTTANILEILFPMAAATWCGVVGEMVATGERQHPVLTAGATAERVAQGSSVTEGTAAFGITTLKPKQILASLRYSREDAASVGYMDEALRMNLRDAIADLIDIQILTRSTDPKGLVAFGTDPTKNGNAVTNTTHALSSIYAGVDGKYAGMASEIRLLLGTSTYAAVGGVVFDTGSGMLGIEKLSAVSGGVRVSANVPTKDATNGEDAVVVKGMGRRNCVSAMWDSIEVIFDPYSDASKAEIVLTAVAMHDFAILDEAGYTRVRFK